MRVTLVLTNSPPSSQYSCCENKSAIFSPLVNGVARVTRAAEPHEERQRLAPRIQFPISTTLCLLLPPLLTAFPPAQVPLLPNNSEYYYRWVLPRHGAEVRSEDLTGLAGVTHGEWTMKTRSVLGGYRSLRSCRCNGKDLCRMEAQAGRRIQSSSLTRRAMG